MSSNNSFANCTNTYVPTLDEVIQLAAESPVKDQLLLSLAGILTIATVLIFFEEYLFIWRNFLSYRTRYLTAWLLGIFPFFSVTAMISIIIPRSNVTCDQMANVYMAICQYKMLLTFEKYYGGERKMILKLVEEKVQLRAPPLACCIPYLPNVKVTRRNFRFIKYAVGQAQFVRVGVMFLTLILWNNGDYQPNNLSPLTPALYITIINTFSQLLGLYGLTLVVRVSRLALIKYKIGAKFLVLQMLLICSGIQNLVVGIVASTGGIPCNTALPLGAQSSAIHHWLLIPEVFLLSLWAIWMYHRTFTDVIDEAETITAEGADFEIIEENSDEQTYLYIRKANRKDTLDSTYSYDSDENEPLLKG